ncbi:PREDICTED: uncharacterized protein LOC106746426 [Dinoponera quadriceps]|uniref:Uncharacterized protein LOC106746426 n=1 Tax=Dinoponera quadriceps TaxID=609295 RepID=A0A6P3XKL7_DINQU|nr:PREDICTED: uncharacterized protein LOC106746426 [Dinoponera quadriceps]
MLLRRALAIATGKSRGHGRIARFKFIDVRAEGPTMVARLPQQVLLLLVLVTGASAEVTGETEDPRWSTYSARKTSRSSSARSWPSSSLEHAARETRFSSGKHPETTPWGVDRSSPGARSDLSFLETVTERSEEDEDGRRVQSSGRNDTGDAKIVRASQSISSRSDETNQTDPSNRISVESSSPHPSTIDHRSAPGRTLSSGSSHDIVPTPETRPSTGTFAREGLKNTTAPSMKAVTMPRRHMRHALDTCEKFQIGDDAKGEFYSPNYPDPYPNHIDCVRVLEADKGMLLKLDFRDKFKIEDSPNCHFDFLEVRDGQHGYSNLLGNFCGPNFPPEITSKTRYLWLHFHSDENIEGEGFRAVWTMIPRPTHPGVPPEPEPCIVNVTGMQAIIQSKDVEERKNLADKEGVALDCMWVIRVQEGWKIQLTFDSFKLQRPNECEANFVDIFKERTDMSSREKNFCGSIADTVVLSNNIAHMRFYAEPKAANSTFEAVMTAVRDKESGERSCKENEYDCEDATCIAAELQCNGRGNCRFRWDEDDATCSKKKARLIDSQHIVIILVVFSLIMFGMSFAFVFNCVRKLVRDHRIIQEHIRQSRENRLDELGRKSTPCPISASRTDLRDRGSESPSLEVLPSKELMPPSTMIPQEYTKELVLEMAYNAGDITDIHQSNNVSNATQERLQESSEEPEMRDNCCQTRESLFEPRMPDAVAPLGFTTFGVRAASSQNGTNHHHYHHHHHHHQSPQRSHQSVQLSGSQPSSQISQCSGCSPASRGRDGSMGVCPKHNPIPAPPGWSTHESSYPLPMAQPGQYPEQLDYPSYQRFQSPKPSREPSVYRQSPKLARQTTVGSGERYGSSVYGSGHGSSNTTTSSSQQSAGTPKRGQPDPRYRAEAVIEVDQRRPFSIESTKSAPDVIATH